MQFVDLESPFAVHVENVLGFGQHLRNPFSPNNSPRLITVGVVFEASREKVEITTTAVI